MWRHSSITQIFGAASGGVAVMFVTKGCAGVTPAIDSILVIHSVSNLQISNVTFKCQDPSTIPVTLVALVASVLPCSTDFHVRSTIQRCIVAQTGEPPGEPQIPRAGSFGGTSYTLIHWRRGPKSNSNDTDLVLLDWGLLMLSSLIPR